MLPYQTRSENSFLVDPAPKGGKSHFERFFKSFPAFFPRNVLANVVNGASIDYA